MSNRSIFSNLCTLKYIVVLLGIMSLVSTYQYVVGIILQYSPQQKFHDNTIRIYEKSRTDIEVLMNNKTRSFYSNMDQLNAISDLNSETLTKSPYTGTMKILKSTTPQNIWISNKQIILKQVDLSLLPNNTAQIENISPLLKQKGQSFFIFNSDDQSNQTISKDILAVFGLKQQQSICRINMMANTIDQNLAKIEQCYKKSQRKMVMGKYQASVLVMIQKHWLLGLVYILICSFIVFAVPYLNILWEKRSINVSSHV